MRFRGESTLWMSQGVECLFRESFPRCHLVLQMGPCDYCSKDGLNCLDWIHLST